MILFLARGTNCHTLDTLTRHAERSVGRITGYLTYESLPRLTDLPSAVFVFVDLETLTGAQLDIAKHVADQLEEAGAPVLNHPAKVFRRLPLLQRLHAEGRNSFRAFRPSQFPEDLRYPVFLRRETDHDGPRTPLIEDRADLDQVLLEAYAKGFEEPKLLVVEYKETRLEDGFFRKYAAFRVGDQIVARHLVIAADWMVKVAARVRREEFLAEEHHYMRANPHADRVMEIFKLANIEYGRIDYSLSGDRMETWEINTNPIAMSPLHTYNSEQLPEHLAFADRLKDAFEKLNSLPQTGRIPIHFPPGVVKSH